MKILFTAKYVATMVCKIDCQVWKTFVGGNLVYSRAVGIIGETLGPVCEKSISRFNSPLSASSRGEYE